MFEQKQKEKDMETVAEMAGYWRANPQRFVDEYLRISLKTFQKVLLYEMIDKDHFYFIASRGLGKTYLVGLYACVRCILWPGTQIVTFGPTVPQGALVIEKIEGFRDDSEALKSEITYISSSAKIPKAEFSNGSKIFVKPAGEGARGSRGQTLVIDESRLIKQETYESIISPISTVPRHPGYLDKKEYKDMLEPNKEIFMSSAWYKSSEMFEKVKDYTAAFINRNPSYFICDFPYQMAIKEGLLLPSKVRDQMNESTYSQIKFDMEMGAKFYGASDNAFFSFDILTSNRKLYDAVYPLELYRQTQVKMPEKESGEIRILSLDVALLGSKKHDNDASCFILNRAMRTGNYYSCGIVGVETREDMKTEELGLELMRMYYQYGCDALALDAMGIGQGVLDYVMDDRYDPEYGTTYRAMTVTNNDELAARCKVKNANRCVWAIKAGASFNDMACVALRGALQSGKISLLIPETEDDLDAYLKKSAYGWGNLTDMQKAMLKEPYYQTSAMIDEMVNLTHTVQDNKIKIKEKPGMRKDRYSSLLYNYYVATEIADSIRPDGDAHETMFKPVIGKKLQSCLG